jgi:ABC-type dipeptide/oligopeptide/nickel transport system permease component
MEAGAGHRVGGRGRLVVQSAQQRDLAALALVVGLFVVLFIVTLFVGPTAR